MANDGATSVEHAQSRVENRVLLYGPPGCAKRTQVRRIAESVGARCFEIALGELVAAWSDGGEAAIHRALAEARSASPAVVLFTGLEAIGHPAGGTCSQAELLARLSLAGQLVAELEAAGDDTVSILATSDAPWDVDPMLLAAGRMNRAVLVPPPDRDERIEVLAAHTGNWGEGHVDIGVVANHTEGYTYAELARTCEMAARLADGGVVTMAMAGSACSVVEPLAPAWFATAKRHCGAGGPWAGHDDLDTYLRLHPLTSTTRIPGLNGHGTNGNGNGRVNGNGHGVSGANGNGHGVSGVNGNGTRPPLKFTAHALSHLA